ncbi:MAG: DsbA family protein [Spirochaetaceae bacterium]|nr:DsbA family protein [Spirochaetaceae bacterium]
MNEKNEFGEQLYIPNTDSCKIACNIQPKQELQIQKEEEKEEDKPHLISVEELTSSYRESQTISTTFTGTTFLNDDSLTRQAGRYALANGKKKKLVNRVFNAMFNEGKDTNDISTILDLAEDVGLDKNKLAKELRPRDNSDEN